MCVNPFINIGTEFVRAGLLPASDAARVRAQLAKYLDLRIEFIEPVIGQLQ
jgi:hypothetical protein